MMSTECLAVRWTFFFVLASDNTFKAYSPLYLEQLGFTSSDISFTILPASFVALLFIPFIGYIADKYRIRKWILYSSIILTVVVLHAHLIPLLYFNNCPQNKYTNNTVPKNNTVGFSTQPNGFAMKHNTTSVVFATVFGNKEQSMDYTSKNTLDYGHNNKRAPVLTGHAHSWLTHKVRSKTVERPISMLIVMIILRFIYDILNRMMVPLMNVAAIQQTRKHGTSFGSYRCFGEIGGSIFIFLVGVLVAHITYHICGEEKQGYFIMFICTGLQTSLAVVVYKFIKFEYLIDQVTTLHDIKQALFNKHYIIMIFISWFTGFCLGYQEIWEFWYIKELSGGPIVMAVTGLLRQPFVALWFFLSGTMIYKFGEMKTICSALFLYAISFLALSFVHEPWLVCVFDVMQSAGYAFSNSSLVVHFAKTGSLASSAVIQAILNSLFYGFGLGSGATVMGLLFNTIGSRITLRCYCVAASFVLVGFGIYVTKAKDLYKYERVEVYNDSDDELDNA